MPRVAVEREPVVEAFESLGRVIGESGPIGGGVEVPGGTGAPGGGESEFQFPGSFIGPGFFGLGEAIGEFGKVGIEPSFEQLLEFAKTGIVPTGLAGPTGFATETEIIGVPQINEFSFPSIQSFTGSPGIPGGTGPGHPPTQNRAQAYIAFLQWLISLLFPPKRPRSASAPRAPSQTTTINIPPTPPPVGGPPVPHVQTSPFGGFGDFVSTALTAAPQILAAFGIGPSPSQGLLPTQASALPGGAPLPVLKFPSFDIPGMDITPQGTAGLLSPFAATAAGASAKLHVKMNPVTGKPVWFRPAGRPVLFSGDFSAKRRVEKIAGRARRRGRRGGY